MMTWEAVVVTVAGLDRGEVEGWIAQDLVRPAQQDGDWLFRDIDVARLQLIQELRHDLRLEEDALPVVLRLMDQLYDARRRLRRLRDAVERGAAPDARDAVLRVLLEG
ncbi:MAG TPA: chaperone modulator CbpM [Acetobacteraceae bacterium]|jgi:chaperone modulatory protein CbpM